MWYVDTQTPPHTHNWHDHEEVTNVIGNCACQNG